MLIIFMSLVYDLYSSINFSYLITYTEYICAHESMKKLKFNLIHRCKDKKILFLIVFFFSFTHV